MVDKQNNTIEPNTHQKPPIGGDQQQFEPLYRIEDERGNILRRSLTHAEAVSLAVHCEADPAKYPEWQGEIKIKTERDQFRAIIGGVAGRWERE